MIRVLVLVLSIACSTAVCASDDRATHPLEPPDRSSPRATLSTFLETSEHAWQQFSAGDPAFAETFQKARWCLDLDEIPPLVLREASAEAALLLKGVLDRIPLPDENEIPDAAEVAATGLTRWTIPHTEITLYLRAEGDRQGQWLFSSDTVARVEEFHDRVEHLPLKPGRSGGHVAELRTSSRAVFLIKMADAAPGFFYTEVAGLMVWQWVGLVLLLAILGGGVAFFARVGRAWSRSGLPGRVLGRFFTPAALVLTPFVGRALIQRLFTLPGPPAQALRLVFSIIGYAGLAWLLGLLLAHIGELTVRLLFKTARPLKKQLVRVIFRIATIAVVTVIAVKALQLLGVPVAGLVAGIGVGGLAIALAAQSTLENFIGGIILYADQPVRVGDICKFGTTRGTVEDVGLRSVKIRTLDRTIVTIPNADFAKMQLENLTRRDQVLLREELHLQYGTPRDVLQRVLADVEDMLRSDERVSEERLRVRFNGFGDHSLEVEIFAYVMTSDFPEFLGIREDLLLKVMAIVEEAGTRLALPTEVRIAGDHPPVASGSVSA
jgi:MscS family membrane protein